MSKWFQMLSVLAVVSTTFLSASTARADTLYFAASSVGGGPLDYNWFNAFNWYTNDPAFFTPVHAGRLPNPDDDVVVSRSQALVSGNVQVASLTIGDFAYTVGGNFVVNDFVLSSTPGINAAGTIKGSAVEVRHQMTVVRRGDLVDGATVTIDPAATATVVVSPLHPVEGGGLVLGDAAVVTNQGSFVLTDKTGISSEPGPNGCRFINTATGTLSSTGQASVAFISGLFTFDNSGLIRADTGTLFMNTGGPWISTSGTGTFRAASVGALLLVNNLVIGAGTSYQFTGPGITHLGATLTVAGRLNVGVVDPTTHLLDPGHVETDCAVDGAGTWHVVTPSPVPAPSTLTFLGDTVSGKRTVFNNAFKPTIDIDAAARLILSGTEIKTLNGTFNNAGLTTWTGPGGLDSDNGVVFNNLDGGIFDAQNDAGFGPSTSVQPVFNNAGTFRKSAGVNRTFMGGNFNNTGTVDLRTATTAFNNYTQTAGVLGLNGGSLDSSNVPLNIQGGTLNGAGTITGSVANGGTISPGHSPGVLNITRDYTQLATGVLNIEVGGTAGTQFDQLKAGGAATLAGALNVQLLNGFHPLSTSRFPVVTYASHTGAFSTVSSPFTAQYSDTAVNLLLPPPVPTISSFAPASGPVGTVVAISGTNLTGATAVKFGTVNATTFTVASATLIRATVPPGAVTGKVSVTTPGGTATSGASFTVGFSIGGRVTDIRGGVPNVRMTRSGSATPVFTDSSGAYAFTGLAAGTFTVTPALAGYGFGPNSASVTLTSGNAAATNFTAIALGKIINGRVTNSAGVGLAGVRIMRTGSATAVFTNTGGNYTFPNVPVGAYSLTASLAGYVFTPAVGVATVTPTTITGVNFRGMVNTHFTISGNVTSGTAPLPGVSGPVPNAPVFLVNSTNLPALAAVLVNPTLLAGSSGLIARTTTNAAGQYAFSVLPGAYYVAPVFTGVFFTPPYHAVAVTTSAPPSQNFAGAGVDAGAPSVTVGVASASSVTGGATDTGAGIFAVVATLQNSGGQYLNWLGTGGTAQFSATPVVGSYKLATAPGSTVPILNLNRVASQNWSLLLPAVLPAGSYRLTVRAIDRAYRVSVPVVRVVTKSSSIGLAAPVALSAATASAATDSVTLKFSGALDAESAGDASHYAVTVDGRIVAVESAGYNADSHSVTLGLRSGVLRAGDRVTVRWSGMVDAGGQTLAGQSGLITTR